VSQVLLQAVTVPQLQLQAVMVSQVLLQAVTVSQLQLLLLVNIWQYYSLASSNLKCIVCSVNTLCTDLDLTCECNTLARKKKTKKTKHQMNLL
jgi:hypothetical protein